MSRLLSKEQVAEKLGVALRIVTKLIRDAKLAPVVRITPHLTLVEEDVLEEFVKARREVGGWYGKREKVARMVSRTPVRE